MANQLSDKIKITSKQVIEQKAALQMILNKIFDGNLYNEGTFDWLVTPKNPQGIYKKVIDDLYSYRQMEGFAKPGKRLRCDFVVPDKKLIIEYDERQHFSEPRRISFKSYGKTKLSFDKDLWVKACADIQAKDNNPVYRDEARAYYDAFRDIASAENGYTLIRIMHGQMDFLAEDARKHLENYIKSVAEGIL